MIPWQTTTEWSMVNHITFCIQSTTLFTWISALLIDASFVMWTFLAHNTLWPAKWRTSNIVCTTWAYWATLFYLTLWIGTTWWRLTWVSRYFWLIISLKKKKKNFSNNCYTHTYVNTKNKYECIVYFIICYRFFYWCIRISYYYNYR